MGGGSGSPNKAIFNWLEKEWQEGSSGECSQLDRKNWFGIASPAREEAGCSDWVPFPKLVAPSPQGGGRVPPKGSTGLRLKPKTWGGPQ